MIESVAYDRPEKWTAVSLGIGRSEFAALVEQLLEMEETSALEISSLSCELVDGIRQFCAIGFVRHRP